MRKVWRYNCLELNWYTRTVIEKRGLVWSVDPIYCAASVVIREHSKTIHTAGLYGLTLPERVSLLIYLNKETL